MTGAEAIAVAAVLAALFTLPFWLVSFNRCAHLFTEPGTLTSVDNDLNAPLALDRALTPAEATEAI